MSPRDWIEEIDGEPGISTADVATFVVMLLMVGVMLACFVGVIVRTLITEGLL